MALLALFTPEDDGSWRVRVFPLPLPFEIPDLNREGECDGLALPDYGALDRRMLAHRAGYAKRLHASGVAEITATSDHAQAALCEWLAELTAGRGSPARP